MFDDMEFDRVEMWFQARNLPASKMNATNAAFIGAFVGEYFQYDVGVANWKLDFPIWRIRVRMLVNHKLITGFFMERINKLRVWIPFRYERLADFCYYCESLYHMESSCSTRSYPMIDPLDLSESYGPWVPMDYTLHILKNSTRE